MIEKNTCKFPRWEQIYYAKVFEEELMMLIPRRKLEAYSKMGILTYAILLGIFPGIPLFFTNYFMANFGQLMYLSFWALILHFPIACVVGYVLNNFIIKKGWVLFNEHKNIKYANQSLEEVRKKFPEIVKKSLDVICEKYDAKMANLSKNTPVIENTPTIDGERFPYSFRKSNPGDNPRQFGGPLSRPIKDHRAHSRKVRRNLENSSRFGCGIRWC